MAIWAVLLVSCLLLTDHSVETSQAIKENAQGLDAEERLLFGLWRGIIRFGRNSMMSIFEGMGLSTVDDFCYRCPSHCLVPRKQNQKSEKQVSERIFFGLPQTFIRGFRDIIVSLADDLGVPAWELCPFCLC